MRVLVTGAKGQLGYDVNRVLKKEDHDVYAFGREELDITNESIVRDKIIEIDPEAIIHCAAYTNVDKAETDKEKAFMVNAEGTKYIAQVAESIGSKLIYISTDYVFDGNSNRAYEPDHQKSPLGVYGESKSLGEEYVQKYSSKAFIVRTAWVYGLNGNNFVKTMLRLANEHSELKVVNDQKGSPTYTYDLAELVAEMIGTEKYGVYHGTNSGNCTWFEFANTIFREKGINIQVNPCTTDEFPRPAPRPKYSVLGNKSLDENGFSSMRHWKEALNGFLKENN